MVGNLQPWPTRGGGMRELARLCGLGEFLFCAINDWAGLNQNGRDGVKLCDQLSRAVMRKLLLIILAGVSSVCAAQSSADSVARCKTLVVSQMEAARNRKRPFGLDLQSAGGARLAYVGVRHTYDPTDEQWATMTSAWEKLQPTIAFYEGPIGSTADSADVAIRRGGEPGLLRFLARKSGVPARSLEPSRAAEVDHLLGQFPPEQVMLFFSLRIVNEVRTRLHPTGRALDTAFAQAVADTRKRAPQLADVLPDTSALRAAFGRVFPRMDPILVPDQWFDPNHTSAETGSVFFNDVNRASSLFRDEYMYDQLAAALQASGARVFAEVGRDHIPAQAAALRCVLGVRPER